MIACIRLRADGSFTWPFALMIPIRIQAIMYCRSWRPQIRERRGQARMVSRSKEIGPVRLRFKVNPPKQASSACAFGMTFARIRD